MFSSLHTIGNHTSWVISSVDAIVLSPRDVIFATKGSRVAPAKLIN